MTAELDRLRNRGAKLEKELRLLTEKELVLLAKVSALERKFKIQERMEIPQRFEEAQKKLEALEEFVEKEKGSFNVGARQMTVMISQNPTTVDGAPILRDDSSLNTVRLRKNMIFSWSYKRLP